MKDEDRRQSGTNVYLLGARDGGKKVTGKVRLADSRGVEITDPVTHGIKSTLTKGENVIGKIILADSEGNELPLIKTLLDGLTIINSVKVHTKTVSCPDSPAQIPGIVTGAFEALDAFGTMTLVKVPKAGTILSATFWDFDDEGTQIDLEIFKDSITQIASKDKWSPSDIDMLNFVTEIQFFAFDDHDNSQTSEVTNFGKAYTCPKGMFWVQAVCRSTPNIATGSEPRFQLQILSDDPDWEA